MDTRYTMKATAMKMWRTFKKSPNSRHRWTNFAKLCLWSWFVVVNSHVHCLWPSWFMAVMVCGRHGLWPSWFVAVMVCGRHCRTLNTVMTYNNYILHKFPTLLRQIQCNQWMAISYNPIYKRQPTLNLQADSNWWHYWYTYSLFTRWFRRSCVTEDRQSLDDISAAKSEFSEDSWAAATWIQLTAVTWSASRSSMLQPACSSERHGHNDLSVFSYHLKNSS